MTERYAYFIAAGRSLAVLDGIDAQWLERRDAVLAIKDRIGATHAVSANGIGATLGFTFAGEPPAGWLKRGTIEGEPYYMPGRRTKDLKAVGAEIARASYCASTAVNLAFVKSPLGVIVGEPHPSGRGGIVRSVTLEQIGDDRIIGIPLAKGELTVEPPADARRLKMSEYYALKEAAEGQAA